MRRADPITPGEILKEEYMVPVGLSQNRLAADLGVPPGRINDIVLGRRGITPDTAARLAIYFGTSVDLWINLQARYDAKMAQRQLMPGLRKLVRRRKSAA